jgi:hypothetical protein
MERSLPSSMPVLDKPGEEVHVESICNLNNSGNGLVSTFQKSLSFSIARI